MLARTDSGCKDARGQAQRQEGLAPPDAAAVQHPNDLRCRCEEARVRRAISQPKCQGARGICVRRPAARAREVLVAKELLQVAYNGLTTHGTAGSRISSLQKAGKREAGL